MTKRRPVFEAGMHSCAMEELNKSLMHRRDTPFAVKVGVCFHGGTLVVWPEGAVGDEHKQDEGHPNVWHMPLLMKER